MTQKDKLMWGLLAAGVVTGIGYLIYSSSSKKNSSLPEEPIPTVPVDDTQTSVLFNKKEEYLKALEELRPVVQSEMNVGQFSQRTLLQINRLVVMLMKEPYVKQLQKDRIERRQYLNDVQAYVNKMVENKDYMEKLIENANTIVLKDLELDYNFYEQQLMQQSQQNPQFEMYAINQIEQLKLQAFEPKNTQMSKDQILQYFQLQLDTFNSLRNQELPNQSREYVLMGKMAYVSDYAAVNMNIEDEDLMANAHLLRDPQVVQAAQQLQVAIMQSSGQYGPMV